jgi:hypothetical protein
MIRKIYNYSDQPIKQENDQWGWTIIFLFLFILSISIKAQNTSYNQWCNELQFARAINDKWAGEFWLGGTFSSTDNESRVFKTNIQRYAFVWVNYYFSPRWKFSSSLAYYYNKDVPDIGQYFSPEYRLTLQANYYIHKIGYILNTRIRGEIRYMMNADSVFQFKYRYRQMLKFVKPINGKVLRKGVFYFITSEELFFKPNAKTTGVTFFDRNRFEIGGGYLITDDFQVELTYVNEFLPRDDENEIYHAVSLTITFNNLFLNLRKRLTSKSSKDNQEE